MSAKRAKFRVGQRVRIVKLEARVIRVDENMLFVSAWLPYGSEVHNFTCYPDELRPLTRRKKGGKRG